MTQRQSRSRLRSARSPEPSTRTALAALPAALPDVGAVISVEEAISWLAYDTPFFDAEAWDASPRRAAIETSGRQTGALRAIPAHLLAHRDANETLWRALRDGTLRSFLAPLAGRTLMVPFVYWSGRSPTDVDKIYWGRFEGEDFDVQAGVGLPILISRQDFESWRKSVAAREKPKATRKRALDHEEIRRKVTEWLREQPTLSKGAAALAIAHDLPRNPKTGKLRDTRHIETIIIDLWDSNSGQGG